MRIDAGIIQPLKWYDTKDKQNFRRSWVKNGLRKFNVLLNPQNSILPFQIRRYHSIRPITILDLYDAENDTFYEDILVKLAAPINDHLRIWQMGTADNIVYSQKKAFTSNLDCGIYYLHLSDGINNWYSEVFTVINGFELQTNKPFIITHSEIKEDVLFTIDRIGTPLTISKKPY